MGLSIDQLLSKAKSCARKGDLQAAAQIYSSVLQRFPKNKRAQKGLQTLQAQPLTQKAAHQPPQTQINALLALLQQGQLQQLVQHATPMSRQYPNVIALHDFLGMAHIGLKNYTESAKSFQKVLQLQPNFPEAHNNLGAALRGKGHLDQAIQSYQKALNLKPNYPEAHNNLGIAYQEQGTFDAAISSFKTALEHAPNYADALFNLGSALKETGALTCAIACFEKGLKINPNNAEALNHLGNALQDFGQADLAVENYHKALKVDPKFTRAHLNLGNMFKAQGHRDDAVASFKAALKTNPGYAEAYRNYTSVVTFEAEDRYTQKIDGLLGSDRLSESDRMHLNFALAKVKLDLGQTSQGIQLLQTANALRKKELNYDISTDEEFFSRVKELFTTEPLTAAAIVSADRPEHTPIFILGMSRSGTTLVEQIISSHSDVYGAGELRFIRQIMDQIDLNAKVLPAKIIEDIRAEYFGKLAGLNTHAPFITDKMPENFKWIGFLTQAFPEAKIIHTSRNPAAVCWSNFKIFFPAGGMRHTFSMADIAKYYLLYHNLMQFWNMKFPNRIYNLNYENLTENQLEESKNLLKYLELDWQDTVMNFHKNTRSVTTASNQQVRAKMYTGSSQEWEKYKDHLAPMLSILAGLPKG